jgi:hypothetical protein
MLSQPEPLASVSDWLGVFGPGNPEFPKLIVRASEVFQPALLGDKARIAPPNDTPRFTVGSRSRSLILVPPGYVDANLLTGLIRRVHVIYIEKGDQSSLQVFLKYLAPLADLSFDPSQWQRCLL